MSLIVVLYDSCVLYPAPLRDLLMHLALSDLYQAKWTNQIHDEWIKNLLVNRPDLTAKMLNRTRNLMNSHVRDCLVENYQSLIPRLKLPDQNDRHVLAAAIHSKASVIVTYNLKDFPQSILKEHKIKSIHPDQFILYLMESSSKIVCESVERHRSSLKNPPKNKKEYLTILKQQSLELTVEKLQSLMK